MRDSLSAKPVLSGMFVALVVAASWGQAEEALTAEFLEYLGEYEQFGDEWVDPYSFAENLEELAKLGKQTEMISDEAENASQHSNQDTTQITTQNRTQSTTQSTTTQEKAHATAIGGSTE